MAIGIDDLDFDDEYGLENDTTTQDTDDQLMIPQNDDNDLDTNDSEPVESDLLPDELDDRGVIAEFLKSKGISDISKITYEEEDGQEVEYDWDSLAASEKLSILQQLNHVDPNLGLNDSEIQLINAIRQSRMSPQDYLTTVTLRGIDNYIANSQGYQENYDIDQFDDESLYMLDLVARVGRENISDDKVKEALERAKTDEELFKKHVDAIRAEYRRMEKENRDYDEFLAEQQRQEEYNMFANAVRDQIINFNEFLGFELNMDDNDKEDLFDFIVGFDGGGYNIMQKAMDSDPAIRVKMAWFALHGELMMDDIAEYIKSTVTKVRRESYNKGVEDAKNGTVKGSGKKPTTVHKPKTNNNTNMSQLTIDDLDY